jgi:hypothetical protein
VSGATPAAPDRRPRPGVRDALALAAWSVACAFVAFWPTIGLPYAFDDLAQLAEIARVRAGEGSVLALLLLPHNEHTLPLLRACLWGATSLGGADPSIFRVVMLLVHASAAVATGLLVLVHTRSRTAAWVVTTVYAAAGFSGSVVWSPTISIFGLAGAAGAWALAVLALDPARGWRSWVAALGFVVAGSAALNTTPVLAAGLPAYRLLAGPRAGPRRALLTVMAYGLLAAVILWLARSNFLGHGGVTKTSWEPSALLSGAWIVYTAPLKFAAGWLDFATVGTGGLSRIAWQAAIAWSAVALALLGVRAADRRVLATLWMGPVALALTIGLGRAWLGLGPLYMTDRYYHAFLLPLAAHAGFLARAPAAAAAGWPRLLRVAAAAGLIVLAAAGVMASRHGLERGVPWRLFAFHERAWVQGAVLAGLVAAVRPAAGQVATLADGLIPFDSVSSPGLSLLTLVRTHHPAPLPNVRISRDAIGAEDAAAQNRILTAWADRVGLDGPPVRVEGGLLRDVRPRVWLDFRRGAHDHAVVSGLEAWDGVHRWTSGEASVRLTPAPGDLAIVASAPVSGLRTKWPGLAGVTVSLAADGTPLGEILVTEAPERTFRVPLPPDVRARGGFVLSLRPHLQWRPSEVDPRSLDRRLLGIAVHAVGFPGAGPEPRRP